jgi:uncharacterized membrane protein
MKLTQLVVIFIICINVASAAILHGAIYDMDFNTLNNVIVQVNTSTPQRFVSKEGQYSFVLDLGSYQVTAVYELPNHVLLYASENISISSEGYYVNDLFLRPTNPRDPNNLYYQVTGQSTYGIATMNRIRNWLTSYWWAPLITAAGFIILVILITRHRVYKKIEKKLEREGTTDKYLREVLTAIRKEGGRATQKDIRKKIPLSEAKISLLITELETKGVISKLKKGRGNIITLTK